MKKKLNLWLLPLAALVLLMSNVYVGRAEENPITLDTVWFLDYNQTYAGVCKPAKIARMADFGSPVPNIPYILLYDLNDGSVIYKTNPTTDSHLLTNYSGDKFYVFNYVNKKSTEFDTKTVKPIRELPNDDFGSDYFMDLISPDNKYVMFHRFHHSIIIKDLQTGMVADSFKIPETPDNPYYSFSDKSFSVDGRYLAFCLKHNDKGSSRYFLIYDRNEKRIILNKQVFGDIAIDYRYTFFNQSNKLAIAEEVQLPGDDTVYSYIRIYDPDLKEYINNIKITKAYKKKNNSIVKVEYFIISETDSKIIFQKGDNYMRVYDLTNDRPSNLVLNLLRGPVLSDNNFIFEILAKQKIDWILVGLDNWNFNNEEVLYPNPTNGIVTIKNTNLFEKEIYLMDMNGKEIEIKNITILQDNTMEIDISKFQNGIYFLSITAKDFNITYKIIKF